MKLMFRVKLLSDLVLNQKSATVGQNATLDFIPGNNFLGMLASSCYDLSDSNTYTIFHSGKVRFGDAHPVINNHRTLRVPFSLFHPKFKDASEVCYVHHHIQDFDALADEQLKQCCSGFCDFYGENAPLVNVTKEYTQKSAHDRENRRSKDSQMYGYEAIKKGMEYAFSVELDDELSSLASKIENTLGGIHRLGRSRSAQYGLVEIWKEDYEEPESVLQKSDIQVVYLDSRLIILDEFGLPSYQPTAADLGFSEGDAEIIWEKSQIRTFSYSPWNSTRQCYDTERCGLEKGCVIVVKSGKPLSGTAYLGKYRNEGFGRVFYNPSFLETKGGNGLAKCKIVKHKPENDVPDTELCGTPLLDVLSTMQTRETMINQVYESVNDWVDSNRSLFMNDTFASQWGQIRTLAMVETNAKKLKDSIKEYLEHGVCAKNWKKFNRVSKLEEFLDKLNNDNAQLAVVNLAAEMGKISGKGGKLND